MHDGTNPVIAPEMRPNAPTDAAHPGGAGADKIELANVWFKSAVFIYTGSSPSINQDVVSIDGSRFDSATTVSMGGPYALLELGTNAAFASTYFNSTFAASLTGSSNESSRPAY